VNGGTTCSNGTVCTGRAGANQPPQGPPKSTLSEARDFLGRGGATEWAELQRLAEAKLNAVCDDEACNEYFGASS